MSLPYFPMFPADFEAKTSHLTLAEDGAYNRLLRICWMTPGCSIPADEAWIMRRVRAHSEDDREAVRSILAEFFTVKNGRYSNARLTKEWLAANEAHERRKNAGAKGGAAKARKTNNNASSNAVAKPKQPEPEPDIEKREAKASPKKGSRLSSDWKLPREWGGWALSQGWPEPMIREEAEKFRDYWIARTGKEATKLDWQATWRNWMRNSKARKPDHGGRNGKRPIADRIASRFAGMDSGPGGNSTASFLPEGCSSDDRGGSNDGLDSGVVWLHGGSNLRCV